MIEIDIYRPRPSLDITVSGTLVEGITALMGHSGSGKTSIMKVIAGLLTPTEGTIIYSKGEEKAVWLDCKKHINKEPQKRQVGYVPQGNIVFPHLSVKENIQYCRWGNIKNYEKIIDDLGLAKYEYRKAGTLSGGEQQRVSLGRALFANPKILLLDEPLSALDWTLKQKVRSEIVQIIKEWRIAALWITHDEDEAKFVGIQQWKLKNGKIE